MMRAFGMASMGSEVSLLVILLCAASISLAQDMPPVPLEEGELVSGRNILIAVSDDTLRTYGDGRSVPFVRTRSVAFDRRVPQIAFDEFRMMGMDFSEFTILSRSGDSLFVTAAPKRIRNRSAWNRPAGNLSAFYPLCLPMGGLTRIYDAKATPENIGMQAAAQRDYSEARPRVEFALAGASLGLLLGTGLAMQFSQARNEDFNKSFERSFLYGGLGALLGIVVVVQLTDF